jgi:ATP-dependent RNA circularization protein (DNA/RNA ligase family)
MKYPRMEHTANSHPTDDDLISKDLLFPKFWIVTEKVDGAQMSIEFQNKELIVTNRGTRLLQGDMDRQFHILPEWIYPKYEMLLEKLGDKLVLFGEWLHHKHTVPYDELPDWFIAYDLWDKEAKNFVPFKDFCHIMDECEIHHVPILFEGVIQNENHLIEFISKSRFGSEEMEGIVIHSPDGKYRYKYVTGRFHESVDQSSQHWRYKARIPNKLKSTSE